MAWYRIKEDRMRLNLFVTYLLCYVFIVVSSLFVLNTMVKVRIEREMVERRISSMKTEAEAIEASYMEGYYSKKLTIETLFNRLRTIDTFAKARILIVNLNGSVTVDSRQGIYEGAIPVIPEWMLEKDILVGKETKKIFHEEGAALVHPIDIDFILKGYVILITPLEEIISDARYHIDTLNISILLLSGIFLIALFLLYRISIVPLRAVIKATREYADGNLNYKLESSGKRHDEFHDLMEAIQFMASELNQMEDYRRKFISNISHDFRSPLTSIKGFANAMMDGTIPPELHNKYLNTISLETERLTKLTSGLIELGKFDSKAALLVMTDFDINQVIKNTAMTFEGSCREKLISMNLIFENEVEPVKADKGKIEQVIYNLIDNAIKFSQNQSEINVSTRQKGNKIFISVKDFGVGIPKEAIKKIWERFYKRDSSRGKDKKGSGLGLAIVKEIIQSHGEEIHVVSTEGAGTEFVFTVSKAEV